jgi:hypothetical protein
MEKSLLWQTFTALTPLECKHLGQWMRSEFINRREPPLFLYDYLFQCLQQKQAPSGENAMTFLFDEKGQLPFKRKAIAEKDISQAKEQAFRLVSSELLEQIEQFLAFKEFFADPVAVALKISATYRKRGLDKHFAQSTAFAARHLDRQPFRHAEYHNQKEALEHEQYQFLSAGRRTVSLNIQTLTDQTDLAFMSKKLRQACIARSHQNVYKTEYQFGLLQSVLDYIYSTPAVLQNPSIALYFFGYHFLSGIDANVHFQSFKTRLLSDAKELPPEEQSNLHLMAINYCIKRINVRDMPYFREAFDLYRSALDGDLLLENGVLSHFAFNNIVAIALRIAEMTWAEQFIHQFHEKIEKKHRNAAYHLNLARVAYERKQHDIALVHLQDADYKDLINNLIAKTLLLKIYYETDALDALDAHLQSMQTFIRRQRIIGYHKTNYMNIIRFTKKLVAILPSNRQERALLIQQISEEQHLTEREWLLAQLKG